MDRGLRTGRGRVKGRGRIAVEGRDVLREPGPDEIILSCTEL